VNTPKDLSVAIVSPDDRRVDVAAITQLINEVYAIGEAGLWRDGARRTSAAEIARNIDDGQLAAAWLDGELVGCVRLRVIDEQTAEFGMLSAKPLRQGIGIGRALVGFAESRACDLGFARMQLELIKPRAWSHPAKELLHAWYSRLGYQQVRSDDFAAIEPSVKPMLATPCDFVVYWKTL
jgi:GNAT superfamily N-acetyltransferase